MDEAAVEYVRLVLALGEHDDGYVDAYYGPPEWQEEVRRARPSLDDILGRARALQRAIDGGTLEAGEAGSGEAGQARAAPVVETPSIEGLRRVVIARQLLALVTRVEQLQGRRMSFDEESRALYDAVAPQHTEDELAGRVAALEEVVPGMGTGTLPERVEAYRRQFAIPKERLDAVFQAAIGASQERTRAHISLPAEERFTIEYVTKQPWSGYNWYQGGYRSLIQVNTDLPIYIERAIDLAAHEGYPGHHAHSTLLEHHLVRERGWVEFSVYALYSPQSLIAEGTANFGIEVAFPEPERLGFERERLFPLAGLDAADAERYYRVVQLLDGLGYAGNEAARRYLDGRIDAAEAARWLTRYTLMSPERARQRVRFIERYRSYVINYNLGKDLVQRHVEARGGTPDQPARRWAELTALLTSPQVPSTLVG